MQIDLRSDTVTMPTPAMRDAMAHAELGDDVYGEDPSVNRLEAMAACLMGKEAAVLVPTGTMGNLASVLSHCDRGREAIIGDQAHIYHYEAGGASALGGVVFHPVVTRPDGTLPIEAIEAAIRPAAANHHYASAGVICLENTHNRCGGRVLTPEYFEEVEAVATRHGLPVHLDGARLFNAAVASKRPVTDWTRHVTSVQFCLSKGLSAPVGSVIAGPAAFVEKARRVRKMVGGGMRQAGVLAAAGMLALTGMVKRLEDDHANARLLAEGLAALPGVELNPADIETNIVIFRLAGVDVDRFVEALRADGVLVSDFGCGRVRAVTHAGVSEDDCRRAVEAAARALQ
jgi:threonine aldolase